MKGMDTTQSGSIPANTTPDERFVQALIEVMEDRAQCADELGQTLHAEGFRQAVAGLSDADHQERIWEESLEPTVQEVVSQILAVIRDSQTEEKDR